MELWQMTLGEWMTGPRVVEKPPRLMTLYEWRCRHGYSNPLDDHGDFRHPHGINKITRRRIDARTQERAASMIEGARLYEIALAAGDVPMVTETARIIADGQPESESALAYFRTRHRRAIIKALAEGQPVPDRVLADYPEHRRRKSA